MANTVTLLSYANTFGDWVVTTNALAGENNNLAANNYIKSSGTLYLNDPVLGLQVANNAVVAGQLQVQGIGSSAYVQNNLRVDQQVYFTNTTLGLVNSGQANIGGPLLALGSGNGLQVSNNATVGGNVIISGSEIIGGTLNVTGNTTVNGSITVANNSTFTNNVAVLGSITSPQITGSVSVTTPTLQVLSDATVYGQLEVAGNFVITGTTVNSSNTLTLNANSNTGITSTFGVNRGVNANAAIRWNEANTYWDIRDVNNPTSYSRIITANLISDSLSSQLSSPYAASQLAANTLNNSIINLNSTLVANVVSLQSQIAANVVSLQSQITANVVSLTSSLESQITANVVSLESQISANVVSLQSQISANATYIAGVDASQNNTISSLTTYSQTGFGRANTSSNTFVGTSGSAVPSTGAITFSSDNGVTINASGNNLDINTPQDLRISASPSFSGLSLSGTPTAPTATNGTNTTQIATTAFVLNELGSGGTFGHSISGTAAYATNPASGGSFWTTSNLTNLSQLSNGPGYLISSGTIQNANYASTYAINYSNRSNANYQILWGSGNNAYGTDLLFLNPSSGALYSYNNITAYYSDDRLKTRLGNIEGALDKVLQLNGFLYVQNDLASSFGYSETNTQVGVSAQEVQKVQPEAVKLAAFDVSDDGTSKTGENYLTVQYDKLVPLLIEAIKELKAEVEELKKK